MLGSDSAVIEKLFILGLAFLVGWMLVVLVVVRQYWWPCVRRTCCPCCRGGTSSKVVTPEATPIASSRRLSSSKTPVRRENSRRTDPEYNPSSGQHKTHYETTAGTTDYDIAQQMPVLLTVCEPSTSGGHGVPTNASANTGGVRHGESENR